MKSDILRNAPHRTPRASRAAPAGTQSVLRALALLKAFSGERTEMDLAQITERVGLSRTTTHRLLAALESQGFIARSGAGNTYRLGPAAIALGSRALRTSDLRGTTRPHLERLAAETGETATLELLTDGRILILDEVQGPHLMGASPTVGTSWAPHATATGKAVLAQLPQARRRKLLGKQLTRFTERTTTDLAVLEQELQAIARAGFALNIEELEIGFVAVAAPITGLLQEPLAGISVGGPGARLSRTRLTELGARLCEAAGQISYELGHIE